MTSTHDILDDEELHECAGCRGMFPAFDLDENGLCEECADPEGYYDSSPEAMLREHGTF